MSEDSISQFVDSTLEMSQLCNYRNPPKGPSTAVFPSWYHQLDCKVNISELSQPKSFIRMHHKNECNQSKALEIPSIIKSMRENRDVSYTISLINRAALHC